MHLSRHGDILVAAHAADERTIGAELERLDDRLFLTKELDRRHGCFLYSVLVEIGGDRPPIRLCDWTDEYGRPLPLTSALLERVKSQRPRGGVSAQETLDANARLTAKVEADFEETLDAIVADMGPRMRETRSAVLHRGQGLRRARARRKR